MERKYYAISTTTDYESVKNIYPQATLVASDLQKHDWLRSESVPKEITQLDIKVNSKTILTDFLSVSMLARKGLLVSERAEKVIRDFATGSAQFIKAIADYKKKTYPYCWVHLHDQFDEIDFPKNSFYLEERQTSRKILAYKKLDRQEYLSKSMRLDLDKNIVTEDSILHVKNAAILSYDIMWMLFGGFCIIVSEELRNKLTEEKFSGVEFSYDSHLLLKAD